MSIFDDEPPALWTTLENGRMFQNGFAGLTEDRVPVVRLVDAARGAEYILTALNPRQANVYWGLADLGLGSPEIGEISLGAICEYYLASNKALVRDATFDPKGKRLSEFLAEAKARRDRPHG
jgi:hypothetical protein